MYVWIWVTIAAALSQSLRTAQQKNLQPVLGNLGASFVRFSYAIPFAWAWIIAYSYLFDVSIPILNLKFFFWVTIAGITQIIFTVLLITLFSHRSFAAGTAFSKTEVLQAAIFEAIILGHIVNPKLGFAILLGVIAVFLLSLQKSKLTLYNLYKSLLTKQAALGIGSGAFLGFCTVAFRAATDSLENDNLIINDDAFNKLLISVRKYFKKYSKLSVSEFKNLSNLSRKNAIPILEYFDNSNITQRVENYRKAGELLFGK